MTFNWAFIRSAAILVVCSSDTTALSTNSSPHHDNISVYDNVLPKPARDILHSAASKSGLGHKVFKRPLVNPSDSPIIERALDSILSELGDVADENNKQYVEYWTRQEWRHIEAHADVDENFAKEQDAIVANGGSLPDQSPFRYPKNGHVLYLKVGSNVRGPTCIFPQVRLLYEIFPFRHKSSVCMR